MRKIPNDQHGGKGKKGVVVVITTKRKGWKTSIPSPLPESPKKIERKREKQTIPSATVIVIRLGKIRP